MSHDALPPPLPDAQQAIETLLTTLLGGTPTLAVAPPQAVDAGADDPGDYLALHSEEAHATVLLDPSWVTLLSEAMLGETMAADAPEAADLVGEIVAQAYGAVQSTLAAAGHSLPSASFTLLPPGNSLPDVPGPVLKVAFMLQANDEPLGGGVLLSADALQGSADAQEAPGGGAAAQETPAAHQGQEAPVDVSPAAFADLGAETLGGDGAPPGNFDLLAEVELDVTVELGRRRLPLADVLQLTAGSVIELEKLVGESLEIYANGRLIAEGEAVVIDEQFGVRITSLASKRNRSKAFF